MDFPAACRELARRMLVQKFGGSGDEALAWLASPNPCLGGESPDDWIEAGRLADLVDLVRSELEQN